MNVGLPSPESENTDQQKLIPRSALTDPRHLESVISRVVERRLEQGKMITKTRVAVENTLKFDLRNFELLEQAAYRELTPDDLPLVSDLYKELQMDPDVFYTIYQQDFEVSDALMSRGGMIHPWRPSDAELTQLESPALKKICPKYVPCEDEFRSFLDGTHGRAAHFRAFGMFDTNDKLLAIACCFIPPNDKKQLQKHAGQIRAFFSTKPSQKRTFTPRNNSAVAIRELAKRRPETTAEFYLIAGNRLGAPTFVCEHMIQQLVREQVPLTDIYLLRYGSMAMVYPESDKRVGHGGRNKPSGDFFERRGFNDCAELTHRHEIALRETRGDVFVGVQPTWTVMHAPFEQFVSGSHTEFVRLQDKAAKTRGKWEN